MQRVEKSSCSCGEPYFVEWGCSLNFRSDAKRVFREGDDENVSVFRCSKCLEVVSESVAGANFEPIMEQIAVIEKERDEYRQAFDFITQMGHSGAFKAYCVKINGKQS